MVRPVERKLSPHCGPVALKPIVEAPVPAGEAEFNSPMANGLGSDCDIYSVWGGVITTTVSQSVIGQVLSDAAVAPDGVIIVEKSPVDPCAQGGSMAPTPYPTPAQSGAVTLVAANGDTLSYGTLRGVSGSFDFETGTFATGS